MHARQGANGLFVLSLIGASQSTLHLSVYRKALDGHVRYDPNWSTLVRDVICGLLQVGNLR